MQAVRIENSEVVLEEEYSSAIAAAGAWRGKNHRPSHCVFQGFTGHVFVGVLDISQNHGQRIDRALAIMI